MDGGNLTTIATTTIAQPLSITILWCHNAAVVPALALRAVGVVAPPPPPHPAAPLHRPLDYRTCGPALLRHLHAVTFTDLKRTVKPSDKIKTIISSRENQLVFP